MSDILKGLLTCCADLERQQDALQGEKVEMQIRLSAQVGELERQLVESKVQLELSAAARGAYSQQLLDASSQIADLSASEYDFKAQLEKAREALRDEGRMIHDAQEILCEYLKPDGQSANQAISDLLELFDNQRQRDVESKCKAALAPKSAAEPKLVQMKEEEG